MSSRAKVAAVQMNSNADLAQNLSVAGRLLEEAAADGCLLAVLPENFAFMGVRHRDKLDHAEAQGTGPIQDFLSETASEQRIWIVSGSIPLKSSDADRCYGACLIVDANGNTLACYNKIHLFDVDLPDRDESYRESASLTPGDELVVEDTPAGRMGLSICYDLRFPEMYRMLTEMGAAVLSVPSAFTMVTGEAHWHTLLRARAIENLAYVIAPGQFGQHSDGRSTYGHSLIIDPWGKILGEEAAGDCVITAELDLGLPQKLRREFPTLGHRVFK